MSILTVESTRFGTLELAPETVIEFPAGLIGLGGARFALVTTESDSAFAWLHSVDDPSLALPVTNPWLFFSDYEVKLSGGETSRIGAPEGVDPEVWVIVRAAERPEDFRVNLRAPIIVYNGQGHQVINEAPDAPVRARLFPQLATQAA
jgi:flagellar assembly factor FliW